MTELNNQQTYILVCKNCGKKFQHTQDFETPRVSITDILSWVPENPLFHKCGYGEHGVGEIVGCSDLS
jgi:hypothetical protein